MKLPHSIARYTVAALLVLVLVPTALAAKGTPPHQFSFESPALG